jgi:PAS domain S-box-containing protein
MASHGDTQSELAKYKLLISSIQDYAIFLMDSGGYIRTWNLGAERNKGYKEHEILGKHFSIFYSQEDKDAKKPEKELVLARKLGRIEDEDWRIRKDGSRFWANVVITALFDEAGELVGYAKVTRNLTERKRQEDDLRHANTLLKQQQDELRRLNAAKDEFVSLASHQLRTPATAVKMILGSVLDQLYGQVNEGALPAIQKAYDSNERQISIVNSLLRVAQVDAGKVVLRLTVADINEMLASIMEEQSEPVSRKGQKLEFLPTSQAALAAVDEEHLRMALANVLDNAIKYSHHDTTVTVRTERAATGHVVISIQDQGVGISKSDMANLFTKFQRIQNDFSSSVSGSGLGLYWTNKIIQLHGGSIEVDSVPDKGTTFRVVLPSSETADA